MTEDDSKNPPSPLVAQLRDLTAKAQKDLADALEYLEYSQSSWRLIQQDVQRDGRTFKILLSTTHKTINEAEFIERSQEYVTAYLLPGVFGQVVSIFEEFLFAALERWLLAHPCSMDGLSIKFSQIRSASSIDEVTAMMVRRELNDLTYESPSKWFTIMRDRWSLVAPDRALQDTFTEIKATRDIHVHTRGHANETYRRKAGGNARTSENEYLDVSEPYLRDAIEVVKKIIEHIGTTMIQKKAK